MNNDEFNTKFLTASQAVDTAYMQLPISGADPVIRERVYCYELYHQLRMDDWPELPYRLNGEVDKSSHQHFALIGAVKPDLILHEPGTNNNFAVIEVKPGDATAAEINGDIAKLALFLDELTHPYQRAILLVFGPTGAACQAAIQAHGDNRIEIWHHPLAGEAAALVI